MRATTFNNKFFDEVEHCISQGVTFLAEFQIKNLTPEQLKVSLKILASCAHVECQRKQWKAKSQPFSKPWEKIYDKPRAFSRQVTVLKLLQLLKSFRHLWKCRKLESGLVLYFDHIAREDGVFRWSSCWNELLIALAEILHAASPSNILSNLIAVVLLAVLAAFHSCVSVMDGIGQLISPGEFDCQAFKKQANSFNLLIFTTVMWFRKQALSNSFTRLNLLGQLI